jgi:hypothetical protein
MGFEKLRNQWVRNFNTFQEIERDPFRQPSSKRTLAKGSMQRILKKMERYCFFTDPFTPNKNLRQSLPPSSVNPEMTWSKLRFNKEL